MLTSAEQFLIESIKNGDKKAFGFLFSKYYSSLWKYARNLVKNDATAEDLVMDLFVKFWETAPKLNFTSSLSGYLFKSLHNHCINYLTRDHIKFPDLNQEVIRNLEVTIPDDKSDDLLEGITNDELFNKIEVAVAKLPEACQRIFIMSRFEDLSHDEISNRLNISKNTIKVQICRALHKIHHEMRGEKVKRNEGR
jgi:RNA polymerase sigma-70 factor, ECF subfamily